MKYEGKPNRLMAVDLLRGYFMFAVIVDHLLRFPGLYDLFTGRSALWVSAAEGFFLLSGMMIGLVRGRQLAVTPWRTVASKVWRRAGKLWLWSAILTVGFTVWAVALGNAPGLKSGLCDTRDLWQILFNALTLKYIYGWADFLVYYAWYLALSPLVLWLLVRRRLWWLVLGGSVAAWALWGGASAYFSWQLPFFIGVVAGYHLDSIEAWARARGRTVRRVGVSAFVSVTAASMILSAGLSYFTAKPRHIFASAPALESAVNNFVSYYSAHLLPLFSKWPIGPGRLLFFLIWSATGYYLFRRYESFILKWLGWFFLPLGQNSLHAYILHSIILFALNLTLAPGTGLIVNFLVVTGVLGLIWALTRRRTLFWLIPS